MAYQISLPIRYAPYAAQMTSCFFSVCRYSSTSFGLILTSALMLSCILCRISSASLFSFCSISAAFTFVSFLAMIDPAYLPHHGIMSIFPALRRFNPFLSPERVQLSMVLALKQTLADIWSYIYILMI